MQKSLFLISFAFCFWFLHCVKDKNADNALIILKITDGNAIYVVSIYPNTFYGNTTLPFGTDVNNLTIADIVISDKANSSLKKGDTISLGEDNSFPITISAENGNSVIYSITVNFQTNNKIAISTFFFTKDNNPSLDKDISLANITADFFIFDTFSHTVSKNLIPSFSLSPGTIIKIGNVVQKSGITSNNFSSEIQYTISNENNSISINYIAKLTFLKNSQTEITEFQFLTKNNPNLKEDVTATIQDSFITADIQNPPNNKLIPSFSTSLGASVFVKDIKQNSGTSLQNFVDTIVYTVISQDNSNKKNYYVSVKNSSFAEITTFSFKKLHNKGLSYDIDASIYNNNQIGTTIPYFAQNKLVPSFTLSNEKAYLVVNGIIQKNNTNSQDFTSPVIYTLISPDGSSSKSYRININFQNDSFEVINGSISCKKLFKNNIKTAILADSMNGQTITKIEDNAFGATIGSTNNTLKELSFPNSLTSIGDYAFYECQALFDNLIFPEPLNSIGIYAFYNCSNITGILKLPNFLTNIGISAFESCSNLKGSLNLSNSIIDIGAKAFKDCSQLTGDINIPSSMTKINDSVFMNCGNLNGALIIPNSVNIIGTGAFYKCSKLNSKLTIPNSVNNIGASAFLDCDGFDSIDIQANITIIEPYTFQDCGGFVYLKLPTGLKKIELSAFKDCWNLESLTLPNTVDTIYRFAFESCTSLRTIDFSNTTTLKFIGMNAFANCGLTGDIKIPASTTFIGGEAFAYLKLLNSIEYKTGTTLGTSFNGENPFCCGTPTPTTY